MTEQHIAAETKRTLIESWFYNLSVVDQMEVRRWFPDLLTEEMMVKSLDGLPAHLVTSWNAWRSCPEVPRIDDILRRAGEISPNVLRLDDDAKVRVFDDQVFVACWVRVPPGEKWLEVKLIAGGSDTFPTSRGGWELRSFNPAHAYCFMDPKTSSDRLRRLVREGRAVRLDFYNGLWLRHSDEHPVEARDRGVAIWVADADMTEPLQEDLDTLLENVRKWRDGEEWSAVIQHGPGLFAFAPVFFDKQELADYLSTEAAEVDAVGLRIPADFAARFEHTPFKCPVVWASPSIE